MPPLRPYEQEEVPSVALDWEPEPSEFAVSEIRITREEEHEMAQAVELPPLRDDEMPDASVTVIRADPDDLLDDPSWGLAKPAPEFAPRKGQQLLYPWDDEPEGSN